MFTRYSVSERLPIRNPQHKGEWPRYERPNQEFIPRYSPEYNGVIERFFRTLKQECVWLHHFESFEQAERVILAWIDRHNTARPHSALRYLTPRGWREQFYQVPKAA